MGQRIGQRGAQGGLVSRCHIEACHRQLDVVLLEPVDARKSGGGQKVAVHPQMREAAGPRPIGQLGVHALAALHQRREQTDVLAAVVFEQLRGNAIGRLRLHRRTVLVAMLRAQLHIQQAQKVPHLGGGANRGFASAAREALLNRHRRRDAVHRVHLRPSRRLHDGAGIRVERFKVPPLPFIEQNVKGQR